MADLRATVQKLNRDNYAVWSQRMEMLLMREGLWEVVSMDAETLTGDKVKQDRLAYSLIGLLLDDSQLYHIKGTKTAKEAWDKLKAHHQKASLSSTVNIYKRLFALKLTEGGDVEAHITELLRLFDRLAALGEDFKDKIKATLLLSTLPDSYNVLTTSLENRPDSDFTLDFVISRVLDEDKKVKESDSAESNEAAFKTVHKDQQDGKQKECFFCKRSGHFKRDCIKYKNWKSKSGNSNATGRAEKTTEYLTIKDEECTMVSYNKDNTSEKQFYGKACLSVKSEGKNTWYVDSGATSHMSGLREFFSDFNPNVRGYVLLADSNKRSEVLGMGSGVIKCDIDGQKKSFRVENVLYVPAFTSSLLSVKKLTKEGFELNFAGSECKIIKNNKTQAKACLNKGSEGLYKITVAEKACTAISASHKKDCLHLWHRRFGHRDVSAIKDLIKKGLATGINLHLCGLEDTVCDCCVRGKMSRLPFPKESKNKGKQILDIIHTDVCGPLAIPTPSKKKYFITLIDDYSRYTEVYFMEKKNEAGNIIKQYIKKMQTQFRKTPKCIRSDRGTEYLNKDLRDYLKNEGINTQYTAPYSPQQNGVAERKNWSLVEMMRCMLIDGNMEKKYWAEAIITANYLQNRLPTKTKEKTPYELWHSKRPEVGHLHVFGSEAYVKVPKELRRKLDDTGVKLTFVGYSEESKAYRLLNKSTDKIIISRDVIFTDIQCSEKIISDTGNTEIAQSRKKDDVVQISLPKNSDTALSESDVSENEDEGETTTEDSGSVSEISSDNFQDAEEEAPIPRRSARSNRGVPPDRFMANANIAADINEDPRSRKDALSRPYRAHWERAMDEEMNSLMQNDSWILTPTPKDRNIPNH